MPDLVEHMYCSQQINVPPHLPSILKKYAKAAIRTQPRDLLMWSLYYFRNLSMGLPAPTKDRIEYPPIVTPSGLTPGFLRVLLKLVGDVKKVPRNMIVERWEGVCLGRSHLEDLFKVGSFGEDIDWLQFVAIAAGTLTSDLTNTMKLLCELLTEEPEGGSAMVPVQLFLDLYTFLARLNCGPTDPRKFEEYGRPVEEDNDENETVMSFATDLSKKLKFKEDDDSRSDRTWDTIIREVGKQDSILTVGTDDIREVDSRAGLIVWPDMMKSQPEIDSSTNIPDRPPPEGVTSDYGLQVWDEVAVRQEFGTKEEIQLESVPSAEPSEKEKDETASEEAGEETKELEEETAEVIPEESKPAEGEVQKTDSLKWTTSDEEGLEGEGIEEEKKWSGEELEGGGTVSEVGETEEEEASRPGHPPITILKKADLMEEGEEFGMPTPVPSQSSICTEDRSIRNLTVSEEVLSTGQNLIPTVSLLNVKVRVRKPKKALEDEKTALGDIFWIPISGIGPHVPSEMVDKVETYMYNCAGQQEGMVMPRNLRHFLCPPLEV